MRFRHLFILTLGVITPIAIAPHMAGACPWKNRQQAVYYAPPMYYAPPTYAVPGAAVPARPTTAVAVSAADNRFDPPTLTVQPGTTIRWTNTGKHPHTVTDQGGKFDSGDIAPGATYSVTFQTPGTYRYYCKHHKGMEGTIVVGEPGKLPAPGPGPRGPGY
jgi:plastocyanin